MELEPGQVSLIEDLENLLVEVRAGEFGDFTNEKYPLPKVELRKKFLEMADRVANGEYD